MIVAQQAPVIGSAVLPLREYLLTGLTATVVTFLLTGPVRVLAVRLGAVAWPRGRDVHSTPTPRWGGLAMLGGVLAGVLLAYQLPALRLAFDYSDEVVGALVAVVVLGVVGGARRPLRARRDHQAGRPDAPPRACSCSPGCSGSRSGSRGAAGGPGSRARS